MDWTPPGPLGVLLADRNAQPPQLRTNRGRSWITYDQDMWDGTWQSTMTPGRRTMQKPDVVCLILKPPIHLPKYRTELQARMHGGHKEGSPSEFLSAQTNGSSMTDHSTGTHGNQLRPGPAQGTQLDGFAWSYAEYTHTNQLDSTRHGLIQS